MRLIILAALFAFFSCSEPFNENSYLNIDLKPPVLNEITLSSGKTLRVTFDEPVTFDENGYFSDPELPLENWTTEGKSLVFHFSDGQDPGRMYKCRSEVTDRSGNTLSFLIRFYGWNPRIPKLVINEFNPAGSGNNPDTVELYVVKGGNAAGIALFLGTSNHFSEYYVLPDLEVVTGDYIIIHLRPEGIAEEISESTDKSESGGKLSFDGAWDIWVKGDMPLSGSNGLITLYTNPFGTLIDAVPYSNRVTADSEDYRGWTAATFDMIEELSFLGGWNNNDGFIRPEDAVSSEGTTGTRSICRDSLSYDSDTRDDWHIVPTGGKSFGEVNSDSVHIP